MCFVVIVIVSLTSVLKKPVISFKSLHMINNVNDLLFTDSSLVLDTQTSSTHPHHPPQFTNE